MEALLPQVDSVCERTLIEVCVSDNASQDGTREYLESCSRPYLRFWTNPTNIGGDRNFLKCIQEATGEYVWLLGDDELLPAEAVARITDHLKLYHPGLLISSDDVPGENEIYENYARAVRDRSPEFPVLHSLISANVFRRVLFNMDEARARLNLSYAHMFGMVWNLSEERVGVVQPFVTVRHMRAEFAKYPSFLCVKQAIYLWWLSDRFALPVRYRLCAIRMAIHLPVEYAARAWHLIMNLKRRWV